jgi:ferredoxin-NADP reductase
MEAAMSARDVKVRGREEVARGTLALHLEKPPGFTFKAGQAVDVILSGGEAHAFSLVSAPFEEELIVATRLRDTAYKRALAALAVGEPVAIDGPFGSLTLHKDASRAAILVAGGIGVTPFMSILRQAARERSPRDVVLLYSNRTPADAAFLDELAELARDHPRIRVVATMTEAQGSPWRGETRFVGPVLLREVAEGLAHPVWYVAGPPAMVRATRAALESAGVDDEDLRVEEFTGYPAAAVPAPAQTPFPDPVRSPA